MKPYALIAEPDTRLAGVLARLVSDEGLEPVTARDGTAAREALAKRGAPALVITDLSLAGVDGFALLRELRAVADPSRSPAIAVSASMALRTAAWRRKTELGIGELLASTMSVDSMRGAVRRALSAARLADANEPGPPPPPPRRTATHDDPARLARIEAMGVVDESSPPDDLLQQLVRETARECGAQIALVSIVLGDRQWFKAHVGLGGELLARRGTPIGQSFCRHVVDADAPSPLIVPDAASHPVFADNDLVRGGGVGSYAGAPLMTRGGDVLGTLCIIDAKPRAITAAQVDRLVATARRVAGEIELRAAARTASLESSRMRAVLDAEQARGRAAQGVLAYLEAVLSNLDVGVLLLDAERAVLYANATAAEMAGLAQADVLAMDRAAWIARLASLAEDRAAFLHDVAVLPAGPFVAREDLVLARPRRRVLRWVSKPIQLPGGVAQLSTYADVTAEVELAEERERLAFADALTGLANRRAAEETVAREASHARRGGDPLSFALIDVDHFKRINDERGHAAGDRVLREVARTIVGALRGSDLAARWGGEEFLAVMPGVTREGAVAAAERVRAAVASLPSLTAGTITVSAGVAEMAEGESADDAIARADALLYEAKRAGRNRVRG